MTPPGTTPEWRVQRERLLEAVEAAEGGPEALVRAVRCSIPTAKGSVDAVEILQNSFEHALWDYMLAQPGGLAAFVAFWGARWAPVGASNDPTGLNAHWVTNTLAAYQKGMTA